MQNNQLIKNVIKNIRHDVVYPEGIMRSGGSKDFRVLGYANVDQLKLEKRRSLDRANLFKGNDQLKEFTSSQLRSNKLNSIESNKVDTVLTGFSLESKFNERLLTKQLETFSYADKLVGVDCKFPSETKPIETTQQTKAVQVGSFKDLKSVFSINSDLTQIDLRSFLNNSLAVSARADRPLSKDKSFVKPSNVSTHSFAEPKVEKLIDTVNPQNYLSVLGYRNSKILLNPNVTFQGVRRFLLYLKKVIQLRCEANNLTAQAPLELIVVLESVLLNSLSSQYLSSAVANPEGVLRSCDLKTTGLNFVQANISKSFSSNLLKGVSGSTDLLLYSLLRLQHEHSKSLRKTLKITLRTPKETISYLSSLNKNKQDGGKLCGVLMLNPTKSLLSTLADRIFNQVSNSTKSRRNTNFAVGFLCAKKGIPLISLCDVASPINFCTYPIFCDTRNIKSIYSVIDLITYGLNQLISDSCTKTAQP